jgi:hypothetical protein
LAFAVRRTETGTIESRENAMRTLMRRLSRWFHSFDEEEGDFPIVIRTAEDGARVGMVGWY